MLHVFRKSDATAARRQLPVEWAAAVEDWRVALAGLSPAATLRKPGASSYSAIAGSVTEVGDGIYRVDLAAADLNTEGVSALKLTAGNLVRHERFCVVDVASIVNGALAGQPVTVVSPVAEDSELTLHLGDDYDGTRALVWTIENYAGYDLTAATAVLRFLERGEYEAGDADAVVEIAVAVAVDGTTVMLTAEPTAEDLAALDPIPSGQNRNYRYQIIATTSGAKAVTLVDAWATMRRTIEDVEAD